MRRLNLIGCFIICALLLACHEPAPISPTVTAPVPAAGLTHASLSVYPDDSADALLTRIASARHRVLLTMYLLTDQRFFDACRQARQNGATVHVLIERQPVGDNSSAQAAFDKLRSSGIEARYANPYFRLTHQKSVMIDNTVVILTANMTNSGFRYNREFGILSDDPAVVSEMANVFDADWSRTPITPDSPNLVWSPNNARSRIGTLIASTHITLSIYAEEVQDDEQTNALIKATSAGVLVRLLISPPIDMNKKDANAADLDKLQRGGVRVRYLSKPYIHAKIFLSDGVIAFIGSQNISTESIEFNRELGVMVSDNSTIQRIGSIFEKDWNAALER